MMGELGLGKASAFLRRISTGCVRARGASVHGFRPCPCAESAWDASVSKSFKRRRAKNSDIGGHENSSFMRY